MWNIQMSLVFKESFPIQISHKGTPFSFHYVDQNHPLRVHCEDFVQQRFKAIYAAEIYHFMPIFLAAFDSEMQCQAVVGLRLASTHDLFLEQYLDKSIELIINEKTGRIFIRDQVVEVGNLSGLHHGSARLIIIFLTWLLAENHYKWVSFTGHHQLVNSFKKLGLSLLDLQDANPERLNDGYEHWGSYYSHEPHVFAADVKLCAFNLNQLQVFESLGLKPLTEDIDHVA